MAKADPAALFFMQQRVAQQRGKAGDDILDALAWAYMNAHTAPWDRLPDAETERPWRSKWNEVFEGLIPEAGNPFDDMLPSGAVVATHAPL